MSIKTIAKTVIRVLDKKAPVILTAIGIGGLVTTAVLSGRAAIQAKEVLDEYDLENMEPKDKREVMLMEVAPKFIPPVIAGSVSIACVVGAQVKNASTIAMLASVYSMKDKDLEELKEKTKEFLGEKKNKELHAKIAEEKVSALEPEGYFQDFEDTGMGDTKFIDLVTGKKFLCNIEKVRQAVNDINQELNDGEAQTVADLYYRLGLTEGKLDSVCGWDLGTYHKLLRPVFDAALIEENEPIITIDYDWDVVDMRFLA